MLNNYTRLIIHESRCLLILIQFHFHHYSLSFYLISPIISLFLFCVPIWFSFILNYYSSPFLSVLLIVHDFYFYFILFLFFIFIFIFVSIFIFIFILFYFIFIFVFILSLLPFPFLSHLYFVSSDFYFVFIFTLFLLILLHDF